MAFNQRPPKVHRAALIPIMFNADNPVLSKMMFMVPSDSTYGGDRPQMAKGQIEEDESAKQAAIREAHEELGLCSNNIIDIIDCGVWLGRTTVFAALVRSDNPADFDPFHEETDSTHWMTLAEFMQDGRDIHQPVVSAVAQLVEMYWETSY
jgi:8-oxo-dGTP pyrophosphatase MutT (NUDIX family)